MTPPHGFFCSLDTSRLMGVTGVQTFEHKEPRTVRKLSHTIWACDESGITDGLEVLGCVRAVIQRVDKSINHANRAF